MRLEYMPIYDSVKIGTRSMLGPNVSLYTPQHPIDPAARNGLKGAEWAKPIVIGDDCWIGGSVVVLAGVTKDVPARSVVVGNPGKVVKRILEDGSLESV
jgi:maltose O-acetyltransferase